MFRTQINFSLRHLSLLALLALLFSFLAWFKSGHLNRDNKLLTSQFIIGKPYQSTINRLEYLDDISFTPESLQDRTLDYRRHLERTTSPAGFLDHHPTLGFDHIYCISLPDRSDRRETMKKIARALGIKITFVDAISKDHPVIGWISEKAFEVRKEKINHMSKHTGLKKDKIGGMGVGTIWLTVNKGNNANQEPLRDIVLPSLDNFHSELSGKNWVEHLWSVTDQKLLKPISLNFNVTEAMWDHNERFPQRQINAATVSTFYNHVKTIRLIKQNGDQSALILEDDVDLEWDLERRWRTIQRRLPVDWETVFLGHCWGREIFEPQVLHPNLHKSTSPLCLHGYAVSSRGSQKLLELFDDPWLAFQTPIDTCIPTFIKLGLKSYSIEPPIINQAKILKSDIQVGKGSNWKGFLADSVMERIYKSEGKDLNLFLDQAHSKHLDPATVFRFKTSQLISSVDSRIIRCDKRPTRAF
ncbi:hypothetical protein CROQUDRAFT_672735 [Cronartium quercuum f. sp. fusiforme G11]|uniref:Uncharacterized protein n=1 Tax=Cronartium quercuum f. sp. fusiforme G11 TaxID=708437 RepID=A0A9P6NDV3_9BASI|nr:hypothetical protein CROQUDRAFT_672735 [Cronartium quercuum f. sp. fusiforme G11]